MNYADIMFYLALAILLTYIFICVTVVAVSWLIELGYYVLSTFDKPRKKKNVPIHGTWDDDDNPF